MESRKWLVTKRQNKSQSFTAPPVGQFNPGFFTEHLNIGFQCPVRCGSRNPHLVLIPGFLDIVSERAHDHRGISRTLPAQFAQRGESRADRRSIA